MIFIGAVKPKIRTAAASPSVASQKPLAPMRASANDWRRQQNMEREISNTINSTGASSAQLLSKLEHAPGVRRVGCPCCDPDNPSNYVDSMMML